jgi:EAL domain-containing protein (putative c-di-GMP-specific phosphodiesterase class I)
MPTLPPESTQQATVLVVDDDDLFLRVCKGLLKRAGLSVEAVNDPSRALECLEQRHFDAVVSDVNMPNVNGISLVRAVREIDASVPVLLMTGAPTLEMAISAIDLGVQKFLPKPFDVDVFVRGVRDAVKQRATQDGLGADHCRLNRALDGMWMAYQPIAQLSSGTPLSYEALLRTTATEVKGPAEVLELAERTGRLFELGRRVRGRVAADIEKLPPSIDLFVNLHPEDLEDPDLYDPTAPLTLVAKRVVLEITERASLTHNAGLLEHMRVLRELGFRVAVDDLGAGYAGLTTLSKVQPEFVKLDASLVRGIDTSGVNQLIVTAMLDLSRELGAKVVAEAIETPGELATLRRLGVDLMQGYYFARPGRPFVELSADALSHATREQDEPVALQRDEPPLMKAANS